MQRASLISISITRRKLRNLCLMSSVLPVFSQNDSCMNIRKFFSFFIADGGRLELSPNKRGGSFFS